MNELKEVFAKTINSKSLENLSNSKIAIAGLGGLGSNVATFLSRCFFGELTVIDFDRVEISNLNRQAYFFNQIGKYKTEAIKENLTKINPDIKIKTINIKVNSENAEKLFEDKDIVIEAFDKAEQKTMLVQTLLEKNKKSIIICGNGMAGIGKNNVIKTKKINDRLYVCGDLESDVEKNGVLVAPRVALCAAHQANLAFNLIIGEEK
ncbi:MAG: sulfur carrier protein ThiS adenylyltransferase ThiF [Clostridia bacterium]|nr:sulfur carrier protein ThiS adenylyltransferase ThiF [Clostridia bacterium]